MTTTAEPSSTSAPDGAARFLETYQSPPGFIGWLMVVNNQPLGKRFMFTAFVFFLLGGLMALLMRIQLAVPMNTFLGPQIYNELFTMHGSTMMFLFAVPFLEGLAIYLIPLMIGSRDLAFPRLTAFGYWMYLFGGIIFYASFIFGTVPDVGWFAYPPLSGPRFSGLGTDFWLLGLSMVELSGITAGIEIVVTILKFRAPGMSLGRMPLFAWAILTAGIMIIFAFTTLLMATILLELDRAVPTRFFDADRGGTPLLWQHLFWFFGHPEVYIIFIPATGIVSMVIAAFARRIIGYVLIAVAIIVTGFLSFGLWVHHMYATGLPELSMQFFAAASLMIAIASGIQIFAWIASLWGTRPMLKTPLMFVLGFVFIFVLGGLTGVMIAIVPFDWQVHDTFFIVAHFHYVLIGGAVFPIFAGLHFWLPKITGRMLSETLGQWSFWLSFIGFNVTFFPMHIMGFLGMPRRVYTYVDTLGLTWHNVIATVGAFVLALGFLALVINFIWSLRRGAPAPHNPWGADTLEWSVESPPPIYGFFAPPVVYRRHPLWDPRKEEKGYENATRAVTVMTGAPETWRATLTTDVVRAEPQAVQFLAGPTIMPLMVAFGILVAAVGALVRVYSLIPAGLVLAGGAIAVWLNPNNRDLELLRTSTIDEQSELPLFPTGAKSVAWWGMISFIAVSATAFGTLIYSYFYLRLFSEDWPQGGLPMPQLLLPSIALGVLLASGALELVAQWAFRRGNAIASQALLVGAVVLAAVFLGVLVFSISRSGFVPDINAYASVYYLLSGLLCAYVFTGMVFVVGTIPWLTRGGAEESPAPLQMQLVGLFWRFSIVAAVVVYAVVNLSPYVV